MLLILNLAILAGLLSAPLASQAYELPRVSCTAFSAGERPLERDYQIYSSQTEIDKTYKESYEGDRRLKGRAYWHESAKTYIIPYKAGFAKIPPRIFEGLSNHISLALKNRYVDGIYYPDMGHAHLYVNTTDWEQIRKETEDSVLRLEKAFFQPRTQALYHTVEMVQLKDGDFARGNFPQDPWKLWRYFSRNLLGHFEAPANLEVIWAGANAVYNTVRDLAGRTEITTLYFSANKNGCFSFTSAEGTKFFDMTFETIPYKNSARDPSALPQDDGASLKLKEIPKN